MTHVEQILPLFSSSSGRWVGRGWLVSWFFSAWKFKVSVTRVLSMTRCARAWAFHQKPYKAAPQVPTHAQRFPRAGCSGASSVSDRGAPFCRSETEAQGYDLAGSRSPSPEMDAKGDEKPPSCHLLVQGPSPECEHRETPATQRHASSV